MSRSGSIKIERSMNKYPRGHILRFFSPDGEPEQLPGPPGDPPLGAPPGSPPGEENYFDFKFPPRYGALGSQIVALIFGPWGLYE